MVGTAHTRLCPPYDFGQVARTKFNTRAPLPAFAPRSLEGTDVSICAEPLVALIWIKERASGAREADARGSDLTRRKGNSMSDDQDKKRSAADADLEREIRQGRKFTAREAM